MIVKIIERPEALRYDVYIYNDDYTQSAVMNEDGMMVWSAYAPGSIPEAWMVFDSAVYLALVKAMIGDHIQNADELTDCRYVRNRLLGMIEAEWMAKVREG